MKRFRLLVIFLLADLLTACSFSLAADVTPPPGYQQQVQAQPQSVPVSGPLYPLVPPDPANGQAIYGEKCVGCHGNKGLGDGPQAANLPNPVAAIGSPDVARSSNPAQWFSVVTQGNLDRFMPPFASLTDRQRWDVIAYVYSLSAPAAEVSQGEQLYQSNCARCHGEQGKGDGPDAASLSVKPRDLSDLEFMASQSAGEFFNAMAQGVAPEMPGFSDQLSEADRWAISDYLRTLTFAGPANNVVAAAQTPNPAEGTLSPGGTQAATGTPAPGIPEATELPSAGRAGIISGTVVNDSGGEIPTDLQVTLHGFDNMTVAITETTTLQPDYSFEFQNVAMPIGREFMTTIEYNGSDYGSDIGMVETDTVALNLPITVYQTTTDASILSVDRLHLFFDFTNPGVVQVIELYIISNPSDKTLIAAEHGQPTVDFKLPEGATNLEFQDGSLGDRYIKTSDGFGDTISVNPGSANYQVIFAFDMPYENNKLDLVQPVNLPVNAVVVLAPEGIINIKGDNLEDAGSRDVQGIMYHMYNGNGLSPGEDLRLTITTSSGQNSSIVSGSKSSLVIGLAAFGIVMIITGLFVFMRSRSRMFEADELRLGQSRGGPDDRDEEAIMDAILALDDLYRAGELPEEAYRQRRAELKTRLKELLD
jgi:mono/diheme cytochrome c family protein